MVNQLTSHCEGATGLGMKYEYPRMFPNVKVFANFMLATGLGIGVTVGVLLYLGKSSIGTLTLSVIYLGTAVYVRQLAKAVDISERLFHAHINGLHEQIDLAAQLYAANNALKKQSEKNLPPGA